MMTMMVDLCVYSYVLVENRHQFWWFGHTYSHTKPHLFTSLSATVNDMLHNQRFAQVAFTPVCSSPYLHAVLTVCFAHC